MTLELIETFTHYVKRPLSPVTVLIVLFVLCNKVLRGSVNVVLNELNHVFFYYVLQSHLNWSLLSQSLFLSFS